MRLQQIRCGGDRNFAYLVTHEGEAMMVDPGEDPQVLIAALEDSGARLRWIVGTHGHNDHIASLPQVKQQFGGRSVLSRAAGQAADLAVTEACPELELGTARITLLATPGHTPCSMCVLIPAMGDLPAQLISGDTLFVGKIGGTATREEAASEYHSLHEVLLKLPDETLVWPGHNYGSRPSSSIGEERRENPFLLQPDFDAFLWLKANWAEYKQQHGIA